jgi:hypothetical protein
LPPPRELRAERLAVVLFEEREMTLSASMAMPCVEYHLAIRGS